MSELDQAIEACEKAIKRTSSNVLKGHLQVIQGALAKGFVRRQPKKMTLIINQRYFVIFDTTTRQAITASERLIKHTGKSVEAVIKLCKDNDVPFYWVN